MEPQTIKINEVEYVRKDSQEQPSWNSALKIVVVDRGFVYIGFHPVVESPARDSMFRLHNAYNIRFWGTTRGLGELVDGPTNTTKLDKVGNIAIPEHAVISVIDVDSSKWKL